MKDKENERENEERPEAAELHLSGNSEREHGKFYRWLDNYWEYHKWLIIGGLFLTVVLLVCILQMCDREKEGDITILTAGPYGFVADGDGYRNLKACLGSHLPTDVNGDGERTVTIQSFTVYSEEEAAEIESSTDENGESLGISINRYANTQEYKQYNTYLTTGEAYVLFLSPYLYGQLSAQSESLVDLCTIFDTLPAGALIEGEGESTHSYGVRLSETALYRENSAIRAAFPDDTVVCLLGAYVFRDKERHPAALEAFRAFVS